MSPKRKPRFTLEQHQETGKILKAMRGQATGLLVDLCKHYPVTQVEKPADRLIDAIDALRCRLDTLVCQEHPDAPSVARIYYGQESEDDR